MVVLVVVVVVTMMMMVGVEVGKPNAMAARLLLQTAVAMEGACDRRREKKKFSSASYTIWRLDGLAGFGCMVNHSLFSR